MNSLTTLQNKIIQCKVCPRLTQYVGEIKKKFPSYWCKPVPSFGDPQAQILFIGLAPGRFGSNRTGRMFTGDSSGKFLYPALHQVGLANQPNGENIQDGLQLINCYITAVVRCAPPQNKPTPNELKQCSIFLQQEIKLLKNLRVVIALGKIAHDYYLKSTEKKLSQYPFKHGNAHRFKNHPTLVDIYHPSRQNTQTGLLTMAMFVNVLKKAISIAKKPLLQE